jgi:hypothetical protein
MNPAHADRCRSRQPGGVLTVLLCLAAGAKEAVTESEEFHALMDKSEVPKEAVVHAMTLFAWVPPCFGVLAWLLPASPLIATLGIDGEWLGTLLGRLTAAYSVLVTFLAFQYWTFDVVGQRFMKQGTARFGDVFTEAVQDSRD